MFHCQGIRKFAEERLSSVVVPECLASLYAVKFKEVNGDNHDLYVMLCSLLPYVPNSI